MSKRDTLCELGFEDAIVFDNPSYENAIIGTTEDRRVAYSYEKMVECLMEEDGMDSTDAMEFIDYNAIRSLPYWPNGPIVVYEDIEGEYDDTVVGISHEEIPVVSYNRLVKKEMEKTGASYEDAAAFLDYNTLQLPGRPIILFNEEQIEFGEEVDGRENENPGQTD